MNFVFYNIYLFIYFLQGIKKTFYYFIHSFKNCMLLNFILLNHFGVSLRSSSLLHLKILFLKINF